MQNKIEDLNNHLFAQIERLSAEELKGDHLEEELKRSKGVSGIAKDIISNAQLLVRAAEAVRDGAFHEKKTPSFLGIIEVKQK